MEDFPFTDEEMAKAGLLGEGEVFVCIYTILTISLLDVSDFIIGTMKEHPKLLGAFFLFFRSYTTLTTFLLGFFILFVLECIDEWGKRMGPAVAPKIVALLKHQSIRYSAIDPARFFTHGPPGEEEKGTLRPVTIWIALHPGTTTVETAHDASLELLKVDDAVVEWREGAPEKLSGPTLLHVVNSTDPTHCVLRFLATALGMPIASATKVNDGAQGSVAFFFHENKNKNGDPIDTVLGVSNCHVLSEDVTVDYEFKESGARPQSIRVNGFRRFQRHLQEIKDCIAGHAIDADCRARETIELEAKPKSEDQEEAEEDVKALVVTWAKLAQEKEDIDALKKFYKEAKSQWSDIESRNIGYVQDPFQGRVRLYSSYMFTLSNKNNLIQEPSILPTRNLPNCSIP